MYLNPRTQINLLRTWSASNCELHIWTLSSPSWLMNTRTDTILAMILQGPLKNHRLLLVASGSFQHVALCTFSLHVCLPLISVPLIPEECATLNVPSPRGLAPVWVHLRRRSPTEGLPQLSHARISANTSQRPTHRKVVPAGVHTPALCFCLWGKLHNNNSNNNSVCYNASNADPRRSDSRESCGVSASHIKATIGRLASRQPVVIVCTCPSRRLMWNHGLPCEPPTGQQSSLQ